MLKSGFLCILAKYKHNTKVTNLMHKITAVCNEKNSTFYLVFAKRKLKQILFEENASKRK